MKFSCLLKIFPVGSNPCSLSKGINNGFLNLRWPCLLYIDQLRDVACIMVILWIIEYYLKILYTIPSQCSSVLLMFINHFTTCFSHRWPSSGVRCRNCHTARIHVCSPYFLLCLNFFYVKYKIVKMLSIPSYWALSYSEWLNYDALVILCRFVEIFFLAFYCSDCVMCSVPVFNTDGAIKCKKKHFNEPAHKYIIVQSLRTMTMPNAGE
jgi:hypothetical protein